PPPSPPPPSPISTARSAVYIAASVLLWMTQGLGMNLIAVNTAQIQGSLGATLTETSWLIAAYMAPNVSLTILLTKIRIQFGLRRFAELSLIIFAVTSLLHLVIFDLWTALPIRFLAGMAAAPVSTLGFLYMLEAFPPAKKLTWAVSLSLTCSAATPMVARVISPVLLDLGQWQQLYTLELGLALLAFSVVFLLPLTPLPYAKVLHWRDFITYPLVAIGFGLLAVVLALGRFYWWFEAPWIGICLAIAALCIGGAAAVELHRDTPLLNIRWLTSPEIATLALTLLIFRIVLAEQTSGAIGLFQTLGLLNEQSRTLYLILLAATLAGGLICGLTLTLARVPLFHGIALICIASGAFMDGHATALTRPETMYFSQALIAFGGALFLPPAMHSGLVKTFKQGPTFITSFIAVFLFTQSIGGLMGSALFGSFVSLREKIHSAHLVEQIQLTNPIVVDRLRSLAGAYQAVVGDPRLLSAEGMALLSRQVTREANVLAYNDAFLLLFAIACVFLASLVAQKAGCRLYNRLARSGGPGDLIPQSRPS
ncbi:MFS transporter, partial [Rhodospirillum rubrum]|uniref:MFS transporter n=2 Tax=Rhodospirillum rubrum TaxID=1085 RepID=UPI001F5B2EFB